MIVNRHANHGVRAQAQLRSRLFDREVGDLGAEDAELSCFGRKSRFLRRPIPLLLKNGVASEQQRHVVRLRASSGEGPVRGGWESGFLTKPADHLSFDYRGNGGLVERVHRLIE